MKTTRFIWVALIPAAFISATAADEIATNRFSVSARLGWNINARFKNNVSVTPPSFTPSGPRRTPSQPGRPSGDPYNYDDGYVLTDVAENFGDMTWYWGYNNRASQLNSSTLNPGNFNPSLPDNTILLSRSTATGGGQRSVRDLDDDPLLGGELTYDRFLGIIKGKTRYGLEAAVNFLNMDMRASVPLNASLTRATFAFPYAINPFGTTDPPGATPGNPYQGSYMGPGFILTNIAAASITNVIAGGQGADRQRFEADLWGFRLGPYLEIPISERLNLSLSAGLAVGILDADVSWKQTLGNQSLSGGGHDVDVLWGGYAAAVASWRLSERWSVNAGGQFQTLNDYKHSFGGRKVEVEFGNTWFVTAGLSFIF